ncbi:MAG: HAD family hydrolase [Syntrophomonadaceae bacterium]|jgi:HAD superfamily phosphoserine phosphatase-like hydrolase
MKLAIFDFDGTLLMKDTLPCLGREWRRQNRSLSRFLKVYVSIAPWLLAYKAKTVSRERMKYEAVNRFIHIFKDMLRDEVNEFFAQAYGNIRACFNPLVLEEIKTARKEGFHLVLLSGAFHELLHMVRHDLHFDSVIAAPLPFKDNYFDHTQEMELIDGKTKVILLQKFFSTAEVDWKRSRSFGDSYSDHYVMEMVGEPVAVNPDPDLLRLARERNWRIINNS